MEFTRRYLKGNREELAFLTHHISQPPIPGQKIDLDDRSSGSAGTLDVCVNNKPMSSDMGKSNHNLLLDQQSESTAATLHVN